MHIGFETLRLLGTKEGKTASSSGPFLLLFQQSWCVGKESMPRELRCLVRHVSLKSGIPGRVKLKLPEYESVIQFKVSGEFGDDGLPLTVTKISKDFPAHMVLPRYLPEALWGHLHQVPLNLTERYWTVTAKAKPRLIKDIQTWALDNRETLRRLKRKSAK